MGSRQVQFLITVVIFKDASEIKVTIALSIYNLHEFYNRIIFILTITKSEMASLNCPSRTKLYSSYRDKVFVWKLLEKQ